MLPELQLTYNAPPTRAHSYLLTMLAAMVCATIVAAGPAHWTLAAWAFRVVCHQLPERCLWIAGTPMPVCARCAGIYFGAFIALLMRPRISRQWMLAAAALLLLDVATESMGLRPAFAASRVATGLFLGWVLAPPVADAFQELAHE